MIRLLLNSLLVFAPLILTANEPSSVESAEPHRLVSVAVMPFLSSGIDPYTDLTAVALRDSFIQRLVSSPSVRVVSRRRAYALSMDAEIRIANQDAKHERASADYAIFGHIIPMETGEMERMDVVIAVFEVASGDLVLLEKVSGGTADPTRLADNFFDAAQKVLLESPPQREAPAITANYSPPSRVGVLPFWIMGVDGGDVDGTLQRLGGAIEQGLHQAWPATGIVSTERMLQILEAHGLNQIGGRADAFAASVAQVVGAEEVVLVQLNALQSAEEGAQWSLSLVAIHVETGIITRSTQKTFVSLDQLMQEAREVAQGFGFSVHKPLIQDQSPSRREALLQAEGALYSQFATNAHWTEEEADELDTELRIEMLEMAIATSPDISDEFFLDWMRKTFELAYKWPREIDVYGDHNRDSAPSVTLNRHADFMHLALNSRQWRNADNARDGEYFRVEALIRMNQPEEALDYLNRIPDRQSEHYLALGQIQMLQGQYENALSSLDQVERDDPDFHELVGKAAFKAGQHEREYRALKAHLLKIKRLSHWRTSQRTIYLMNEFEPPEERIQLIQKYAGDWAKGTDVAQYTLARAQLETGMHEQALPVLRVFANQKRLTGILGEHSQIVRKEISRLLALHSDVKEMVVRYADVQIPPADMRYYIQPLGYTDADALQVAIEKAEWFSGIDFVLLPTIELPVNEYIYDAQTRQYDAQRLQAWLHSQIDLPDDALHYCFVVDRDIRWNRGWIYANTMPHGATVMSDYRWRLYYNHLDSSDLGKALAKSWLTCMLHPIKRWMGKETILKLTGSETWPNHAGTIQYSKGTAREVFEAPFQICPGTQKLYAAVDWKALFEFRKQAFLRYQKRYCEMIQTAGRLVGPPLAKDDSSSPSR